MKGSIDRWSKQNARKPSSSPDRGVIFFVIRSYKGRCQDERSRKLVDVEEDDDDLTIKDAGLQIK